MEAREIFTQYLSEYGVDIIDFECEDCQDYGDGTYVLIVRYKDSMVLTFFTGEKILTIESWQHFALYELDEDLSADEILVKIAARQKRRRAAEKNLAEMQRELSALRAENAELRLLPDAPEYLAAKARFETAAKQ
jgi:hypothetical protein